MIAETGQIREHKLHPSHKNESILNPSSEFKIAENGMEILGHFSGFEGLMSGSAKRINVSFNEEDAEREFIQEIEQNVES